MPRILGFLLAALLCVPLEAQRPPRRNAPPAPAPSVAEWPIESLAITGNSNYPAEAVLRIAGLHAGQRVTPKDIENARDRIQATGAFESVGFQFQPGTNGKGYAVTFQVVEAGPFFPLRFEDLKATPEELRGALEKADPLFTGRIPANDASLARYSRILETYLAGKGQHDTISGKLMPENSGALSVLFRPAAAPPAIARVIVTGTEAVDNNTVVRSLADVAVGVPYRLNRFRELLDSSVRPVYDARGRVRVSFTDIKTEPAKDVNGVIVSVRVVEGPVFTLGSMHATGTGLPEAEIQKTAGLKSGDRFNADQVKGAATNIEKRLRRAGYMDVKETIERKVNDGDKTVGVSIAFDKGPQYLFGKLNIEGLDIQSEPVVRKMWGLLPGKPFNAEYPDHFLSRVREDGVFEKLGKTTAKVAPNPETQTVDVTLVFSPVPPEKPKRRDQNDGGASGGNGNPFPPLFR